jgi:hypothetical protein
MNRCYLLKEVDAVGRIILKRVIKEQQVRRGLGSTGSG